MARKGYKTSSFTLPDGTRKYVYAKTQEELDQKVFDLKLQMKMGVDLKDQTTVAELIKMWYDAEVVPSVKDTTAANLKCILNKHLMPLVDGYPAKDVTPMQVKMWLNETGKLNKNAAKCCLRALKQAFNIAEENGVVFKNPVLARYKPGGKPNKTRDAITPAEEKKLLEVTETSNAHLLVWFLLATGVRRGEALGLKWDCVDLDNGTIHIRRNLVFLDLNKSELRDYTKTEAGVRVLPLPEDLCSALRAEKAKTNSMYVFHRKNGECFTGSRFQEFWGDNVTSRFGPNAKHTKRIQGYTSPRNVTPHVLRHTYATRCFEAGMDIKEVQHLMGHASPDVTLKIYTHYCLESRREETFEKARTARAKNMYHTDVVQKPTLAVCTTGVPHKIG